DRRRRAEGRGHRRPAQGPHRHGPLGGMSMSLGHNVRSALPGSSKAAERDYMPELAGATLQDSPRLSRLTVWLAALLLLVAMVWAHFAVLDEVTVGEGKAIPSSKVQVVQNLEGGIVTEIFAREGQMVDKGATLLR